MVRCAAFVVLACIFGTAYSAAYGGYGGYHGHGDWHHHGPNRYPSGDQYHDYHGHHYPHHQDPYFDRNQNSNWFSGGNRYPEGQWPGWGESSQGQGGDSSSQGSEDGSNQEQIARLPVAVDPEPPAIIITTPSSADAAAEACTRDCPVTSQYSPVCGSNNVTYGNIGRLECAQACGVVVTLVREFPCVVESNDINANTNVEQRTVTTLAPAVTSDPVQTTPPTSPAEADVTSPPESSDAGANPGTQNTLVMLDKIFGSTEAPLTAEPAADVDIRYDESQKKSL